MLKPTIKAILFDKDGTLIDLMYTWYPLFRRFIEAIIQDAQLDPHKAQLLARDLGDSGTDFSPDSVFAHGTFPQILQVIQKQAPDFQTTRMEQAFKNAFENHDVDAKPIGEVRETLISLQKQGYILGVATADQESNTRHTLNRADLLDLFPFIGTRDSVKNGKPDRDLMDLFCELHKLEPQQVAMVGDTRRDMEFARNSGAGQVIFVRTTFPDPQSETMADLVLENVNFLVNTPGHQHL